MVETQQHIVWIVILIIVALLALTGCAPLILPGETMVQVCKAPAFRRAKEFIVQDKDGHLFYVDLSAGTRIPVTDGVKARALCKSRGSRL